MSDKRWAKMVDGVPAFAQAVEKIDGKWVANPTDAQLRADGFKLYVDNMPTEPAAKGYSWKLTGYDDSGEDLVCIYEQVKDPSPTLADYDSAMERRLRSERAARGYTTREPDAYLTSSNPRWSQDARDWVAHRDAVMEYALNLINAVQSGEREPPTMEEFTAGLPGIVWTYSE